MRLPPDAADFLGGQLFAVLDSIHAGVLVEDRDGRAVFLNKALARLCGVEGPDEATFAERLLERLNPRAADGSRLLFDTLPGRRSIRDGRPAEAVIRYGRTGENLWSLLRATPLSDRSGVVGAVTIFHDLVEPRRDRVSSSTLSGVQSLLEASFELQATLEQVVSLAVPSLCDLSTVDLLEEDGSLRRAAERFSSEELARRVTSAREVVGVQSSPPELVKEVVRTGEPVFLGNFESGGPSGLPRGAQEKRLLEALQLGSLMCLPLITRGRCIGAIKFILDARDSRVFSPADLFVARELAARAALAVDNARLFTLEHEARTRAERAAERLERLQAVTALLSQSLTAENVAQVILREGLESIGADAGAVVLLEDSGRELTIAGATGYSPRSIDDFRAFNLEARLPVAEAVRRGEAIFVSCLDDDFDRRFPDFPPAGARMTEALAAVPLHSSGRIIGAFTCSFRQPHLFDEEERRFLVALARQCAQALERSRLYEAEAAARRQAEQSSLRAQFLAEAGRVLASSLDYERTLENASRMAVPRLADWAAVHIIEDGEVRRLVIAHEDPELEESIRSFLSGYPYDPDAPHGAARVFRTGEPELANDIPDSALELVAQDEAFLEMLRRVRPTSLMVVPLRVREEVVGTLSFFLTSPSRRYTDSDLSMAMELARRAALAVENARLHRAAQEASRAREETLAMVSHDLRNPLGAILLNASFMLRMLSGDDARMARRLEVILRAGERMRRLVDDLLDLARIESGRMTVTLEQQDLASILSESLETMQPLAAERRITLSSDLRAGACVVSCDRDRVLRVLTNLLGNAIKFTPEGGSVSLVCRSATEGVEITVSDTGPGIAPDMLPRIFERFWKGRDSDRGGAGLGLYISRGFVEAHGGRLWAESEPGRGSRFRFVLPRTNTPAGGERS